MKRKIEELRASLADFLEQRDNLTLVLQTAQPSDLVYVLKYLEAMEQVSAQDIYLVFTHSASSSSAYVNEVMTQARAQIEAGNQTLVEGVGEEGCEPWPPLPAECTSSRLPPFERIRALITYVRERKPDIRNHVLLALLPLEVGDHAAYASAVDQLFVRNGIERWMAGVRIVLWDSKEEGKLVPALRADRISHALVYPIDFSTPAMINALAEDAVDPSVPEEDRMMALVQLAGIDHGHRRPEDAIAKYGIAYNYYARTKNAALQATCLLGCALVQEHAGQTQEAWQKYRQALELGIANDIKPVMLNATKALAGLYQRAEEWQEAQNYWHAGSLVAMAVPYPILQADMMEQIGICRVALGDEETALEVWKNATKLAEDNDHWERVVSLLQNQIEIERRNGLDEPRCEHEQALERARQKLLVHQHEHGHSHAEAHA